MSSSFKSIPNFSLYAINENQVLINKSTGYKLKPYLDKEMGYYFVRVISDDGRSMIQGIHQLVCLAFHEKAQDDLVVNHKDGVKINNHPSNLEWCTRAANNYHAFETGLNNCHRCPVLMKNLNTGEITSFWSATAAAKALKWSTPDRIHNRIRRRPGAVYTDGLLFKYDDGSEWPPLREEPPREARKIIARNVVTGRTIIFITLAQGAELTGVSAMAVLKAADAAKQLPCKGWIFRHYHKFDGFWPDFDEFEKEIIAAHQDYQLGSGVIATKDDEVKKFASVHHAASVFGTTKENIYKATKYTKPINGWCLKLHRVSRSA